MQSSKVRKDRIVFRFSQSSIGIKIVHLTAARISYHVVFNVQVSAHTIGYHTSVPGTPYDQ